MSDYGPPKDPYQQPHQQPPWAGAPTAPTGPTPPLAPWHLRVGGTLIDIVLLLPFYVIQLLGTNIKHEGHLVVTLLGTFVNAVGALAMIGFAIWNHVVRQGRTGATVGKGVIGIKLVRKDSLRPTGGGVAFLRQVLHFLDSLPCMIGFLWPLWDVRRQTFADKIVGTFVIVEPKS